MIEIKATGPVTLEELDAFARAVRAAAGGEHRIDIGRGVVGALITTSAGVAVQAAQSVAVGDRVRILDDWASVNVGRTAILREIDTDDTEWRYRVELDGNPYYWVRDVEAG